MADKIDSSTEGYNSLIRIQNSISVTIGQPHLYKNFWFGVRDLRAPTILFGYMHDLDSEGTTLKSMMRLIEILFKYDPLLSLSPSSMRGNDSYSERVSKVMPESDSSRENVSKSTLVGS